MATLNRVGYLQEALDSIFAQTSTEFEIVLVNDGSTNGTQELYYAEDAYYL